MLVARLNRWLDSIAGDTGRFGPVHLNLGLNPKARLNEHPEFERVRGAVTMGMGDSSIMMRMFPRKQLETVTSDVHWDFVAMRPTIALDGQVICDRGCGGAVQGVEPCSSSLRRDRGAGIDVDPRLA